MTSPAATGPAAGAGAEGAGAADDDFFKRGFFEPGAGQQGVRIVDIGLQVLPVMEGEGLGADGGRERVRPGVGQWDQNFSQDFHM